MRTRTLLLLAVACGAAILAAGVFQLLRLAGQEEPERPAAVGAPLDIGDLTVVVVDHTEYEGRVDVVIELGGVDDPDAAAEFRLVVPGESLSPVSGGDAAAPGAPACGGSTVELTRCTLSFDLPDEPGTARVLLFRRGDEQARWELTGT